ncbi:MAG: D-alanyl-D-alanine dipeptidase [Archangium gephyra]|uniref:D-alanyl-D-alanine dipeptidase n=1 Tax=Archangium gephyra TaxID=48 RepID=A0A2W5SYX9_9BACT|nr:MAG: D-alanyl-D-alanine dipeptidase [Archangium gephyra]
MRQWDSVTIDEDGEPLVPLDGCPFSFEAPHPYVKLGAPYDGHGPWFLRKSVCKRLVDAQRRLCIHRPGWKLHLFDAWRPLAVQAFMVEQTEQSLRRQFPELSHEARMERVLTYWAPPNEDPKRPPPHSTGAAVDLTLMNEAGELLDMGSPFDEPTERSWPDHFQKLDAAVHQRRMLLCRVMRDAGFVGHRQEWWHFSFGDRAWAREMDFACARYGRAEPKRS